MSSPDLHELTALGPSAAAPARVRYRCRHVTRYSYADMVTSSQLLAHLAPRPHPRQTGGIANLTIWPVPALAIARLDWFGNPTTYASIQVPHENLTVTSELIVEVRVGLVFDPADTPPWEQVQALAIEDGPAAEFLAQSPRVPVPNPDLAAYAAEDFLPGRPVAEAAIALMRRIHREFTFRAGSTTVSTPVAEVLAQRCGVCQDFAHLMIGCLRVMGVPARYVSGYLRTLPPPGQMKLQGADASHAWLQAWCGPRLGWLDLDPTNATLVELDHLTVAWGRDYDDVCPLRGVILGGGSHTVDVAVDVEEIA
ncbi:transglutaminase family protein [Indioceanicola profundi]|uniref:transglutaminase family protein n=1 Tax=Indioceanicola profundi TaxID=2220096 RepID=UPI000E6ABA86|nr:transglutaminase family protein [Indioceanicola profundi]